MKNSNYCDIISGINSENSAITHSIIIPTFSGNTEFFTPQQKNVLINHLYPIQINNIEINKEYKHSRGVINYINNLTNSGDTKPIIIENGKFEINIKRYEVKKSNDLCAVTSPEKDYKIMNSGYTNIQSIYDWSNEKYLKKIKLATSSSTQIISFKYMITIDVKHNVEKEAYVKITTHDFTKENSENNEWKGAYFPILYEEIINSDDIQANQYNVDTMEISRVKTIIINLIRKITIFFIKN